MAFWVIGLSAPNALAQKTLGEEQVQQTLAIIVRVQSQLPLLTQTCSQSAET